MERTPTYAEIRQQRAIARHPVFEAGMPGGPTYHHPLPRSKFLVAAGPPELFPEEYDTRIDTDAAYDPASRARGLAWIIRVAADSEIHEGWFDREGGGNNCAEISALIGALMRAGAEGRSKLLIRTDNRLASHLLARVDRPRLERVSNLAARLWSLLPKFEAVAVAWCPERALKEVDRLSKSMIRRRGGLPSVDTRGHMLARVGKGHALKGVEIPEFTAWMAWEERFP